MTATISCEAASEEIHELKARRHGCYDGWESALFREFRSRMNLQARRGG